MGIWMQITLKGRRDERLSDSQCGTEAVFTLESIFKEQKRVAFSFI